MLFKLWNESIQNTWIDLHFNTWAEWHNNPTIHTLTALIQSQCCYSQTPKGNVCVSPTRMELKISPQRKARVCGGFNSSASVSLETYGLMKSPWEINIFIIAHRIWGCYGFEENTKIWGDEVCYTVISGLLSAARCKPQPLNLTKFGI